MLSLPDFDIGKRNPNLQLGGRVDLPRMQEGGLDAAFFAVFIDQDRLDQQHYRIARKHADGMIDCIYSSIGEYSNIAEIVTTPQAAYEAKKSGHRAIFIGLENGYPLGSDLSLIGHFFSRGIRYITLCHEANNQICDSSGDSARHAGLSRFGIQVVQEMNRLGMMIDVSHLADASVRDVLDHSRTPIIASHSCAHALCDHYRNLPDDLLRRIADGGGVIQVCFFSDFVKKPKPYPERDAAIEVLKKKYPNYAVLPSAEKQIAQMDWDRLDVDYVRELATIADVVDHIDHIVRVAGIDHVGIGTDLDGGGEVQDLYNVSQMKNITRELVRRGYSDAEIEKIWGANFMRVFGDILASAKG